MTARHQLPGSTPIETMVRTSLRAVIAFIFFHGVFPKIAIAETVNVAVVANFTEPAKARFSKIVLANPAAAPCGLAAIDVLTNLNAYERLRPKIVERSSIAEAFQLIETKNTELGFIALSQIKRLNEGSWWIVPQKYYRPIHQDAILLTIGANNPGARAFMAFLKTKTARTSIENSGYDVAMIDGQKK